jgi:hypothetical protein
MGIWACLSNGLAYPAHEAHAISNGLAYPAHEAHADNVGNESVRFRFFLMFLSFILIRPFDPFVLMSYAEF